MANCYRCGRPILDTRYHLRRRLRTGDWERRRYLRPKSRVVETRYGMRVVCTRCAHILDRQAYRLTTEGHWQVIVALIVLFIVLALFR